MPLARWLLVAASIVGAATAVAASGCGQPSHPSVASASASTSATAPSAPSKTDYLVFAQERFEPALRPLVELREREGHGVVVKRLEDVYRGVAVADRANALRDEIRRVADESPALRFVLLAGDPRSEGTPLPAFRRKLGDWAKGYVGQVYATDHDYALATAHGTKEPLAVGRLPARSEGELEAMVDKIVAYAAAPPGAWQRKVGVFAGPVNLGQFDSMVEDYASEMLNDNVPYAFDLRVMFASPTSPYAFGFDRFKDEMIDSLGQGSLMSVYAGHASETTLSGVTWRGVRYPIGGTDDFARIGASSGNGANGPILVILTCESGAFDMKSGRSIAEAAALARRGPIAVFAAAAVSSAMVNFGYSDALIDAFLVKRAKTVGEGLALAKKQLPEGGSFLGALSTMALDDLDAQDGADARAEHVAIYNLFGDPGAMPHYPTDVTVGAPAHVAASGRLSVSIAAGDGEADVVVTIESSRKELKTGIVAPAELDKLTPPEAFAAMSKNNAIANDKVLSRATARGRGRPLAVALDAPTKPGTYWIKASGVVGGAEVTGVATLEVD